MGQALVFGLIGSSALVIGGAIGAYWRAPHQISGVLLAFASGTLISALAFELFPEAVHLGGLWPAGFGLIAGGLTFVVVNTALDSWVARSAGDPQQVPALPSEAAEDVSGAQAQQTERVEEAATGGARAAVGFALLAALGGRGPGPGYLMRRFWLNHEKGLDPDELFGGGGDNIIMAADGSADHVNCGSGTEDTASVDETDNVNENCENATATVPATAAATAPATAPPATTPPAAVTAQPQP